MRLWRRRQTEEWKEWKEAGESKQAKRGNTVRHALLPGGIDSPSPKLLGQCTFVKCRCLMRMGLTAPASFNERLYFLMKTTLQWILEVGTLPVQVPSSQLTSCPPAAVIYGTDISYEYWRCRVAEMGIQQNASYQNQNPWFFTESPGYPRRFVVVRSQIKWITKPRAMFMLNGDPHDRSNLQKERLKLDLSPFLHHLKWMVI